VPFPDHNATTPLHPAAALAARQLENEGWGARALKRPSMDRMAAAGGNRSDRSIAEVGGNL
jgi:hypothetical protein